VSGLDDLEKPPGCTCPDDDMRMCIDGEVYGHCGEPYCGGVCEPVANCRCHVCHGEVRP
jgi:hypothetical protein